MRVFFPSAGQDADEAAARSSALNLAGRLRNTNAGLIDLENMVRQSPAAARTIGRELIAARTKYSDTASRFQYWYTMLFGSPAEGLSLGPVAIATIIAGFALVATLIYELDQWIAVAKTRAQTAQAQVQQAGSLQAAAAAKDVAANDADARGDTAAAARLRAERDELLRAAGATGAPGAPKEFGQWFQENWGWVAAAVAGIIVLPRILE